MNGYLIGVHIADGVLAPRWWIGGWLGTALLLAVSAWRISADDIPRLALVSACCFVASSLHIPVPAMTSVHLLLNNLAVLLAGWRAMLAIFPALALQALLLNHGGLLALGVNTLVYTLPALAVWGVARVAVHRFAGLMSWRWAWLTGSIMGATTVLATISLNAFVLYAGGDESWPALATLVFLAHLPVVGAESAISGSLLAFLVRVKPTLLALPCPTSECQQPSAGLDHN